MASESRITGTLSPAQVVTRTETLLKSVLKAKTYDELREYTAGLQGMRLFKPTEAEIVELNEFARMSAISKRMNESRFVVEGFKVLIQRIVARSVKEEYSREQSLFTKLLTAATPSER